MSPRMSLEGAERVLAVLLSAPVTRMGTTAFERCFIAFCMFWSLNLIGVFQVNIFSGAQLWVELCFRVLDIIIMGSFPIRMFQGSLYDVYTNPKTYANIDTLGELDRSGIIIAVLHQGLIVDVFGDERPGSHLGNLRLKLYPTTLEDDLMARIARTGKEAGLERLLSMPKVYQQYVRTDGTTLLHTIDECPRYEYMRQSNHRSLLCHSGERRKLTGFALFVCLSFVVLLQVVRTGLSAGPTFDLHGVLQSLRGIVCAVGSGQQMDGRDNVSVPAGE